MDRIAAHGSVNVDGWALLSSPHKGELGPLCGFLGFRGSYRFLQLLTHAKRGNAPGWDRDGLVRANVLDRPLTTIARIEGAKPGNGHGLALTQGLSNGFDHAAHSVVDHAL